MSQFVVLGFKAEFINGKQVDWVEIAPSGEAFERTHTWLRVKDIIPPEHPDLTAPSHIAMVERWKQIGPAYEAWRNGQELPEDGTPLAAWSGVSPEQAAVLVRMGLKTVEAVRDMSESAIVKLPFPNARKLPALAGEFLSGRDKVSQARELDAMREKMAAMEEMLAGYIAAETTAEKRGPGRPRKQEADAA